MFLKLSHKSSQTTRRKGDCLPPPLWISSSSLLRRSPPWRSKHPVWRRSHQGRLSLRASSWRPSEVHLLSVWTACFPFLPLISCPASSPFTLPVSPLVWSAVTLLDAGLGGGGFRLMAAKEPACDTHKPEKKHRKSSSLPPSIIPEP